MSRFQSSSGFGVPVGAENKRSSGSEYYIFFFLVKSVRNRQKQPLVNLDMDMSFNRSLTFIDLGA